MLTDEQIDRLMNMRKPYTSAKAIEKAVQEQDTALIKQLAGALEWLHLGIGPARDPMRAIRSARARLEKAP